MKMLDPISLLRHFGQQGEDIVERRKASAVDNEVSTKEDLKKFKKEIVKLPAHGQGFPAM